MPKILKSFVLIVAFAVAAMAQIQLPVTQAPRTPSPNAPSGSCFTSTLPVHDYVLGVYWYCVPNTAPPLNLGTWTSYTLPTSVAALNSNGQIVSATSAQVNALATNPAALNGLTISTTTGTLSLANSSTLATAGGNSLTLTTTGTAVPTFPAATDTVAELTQTQTLTNKTLTSPTLNNPVITGPAPVACGATCSPTAGQLILLNQGAGSTVTLPTSAGTGNMIRMRVSVITASAAEKVLLTTTTDVIIGTAYVENGGTVKAFVGNAGTFHSLQMPFAGSQPSGGFVGDTITCTDLATGTWACDVSSQSGTGTQVTPYSASTT